jgi:hypothetical protein
MDDKIKDGIVEWLLLFGSRAVPHHEVADNKQYHNAAFLIDSANGDIEYIIDTTPNASVEGTLWQLTPAALEIFKGK